LKTRKLLAILVATLMVVTMLPGVASAAVTVTPAALTTVTAGTPTNLAGTIVLQESAAGELGVGNIVITAPSGVTFNTGVTPDAVATAGNISLGTVSVTASTITIPVTAVSTTASTITIGGTTKPQVNSTTVGSYNLTVAANGLSSTNCAPIDVVPAAANRFASSIDIDKTTVDADGTDYAEVTVYVYDQYYNPVADGTNVYVATDRGATDIITATVGTQTTVSNVQQITTSGGKIEFQLSSNIAGTAKLGVGLDNSTADALYNYLNGATGVTAATAGLIGTEEITFSATSANTVTVVASAGPKKANGVDSYTITATVRDAGGNPVKGVDVEFSTNKAGLTFNYTTKTTDSQGKAEVKVTATKATTYTIYADVGNVQGSTTVTFSASGAYDISVEKGDNQKVAKGTAPSAIKFKVVDINGNKYNPVPASEITFDFTTKPSGSNVAATPVWDAANSLVEVNFTTNPDKVGTYVLQAALDNGKTASVTFEYLEQGTITELTIEYDEKSLPYGGVSTGVPTLKYLDANGVAKTATGSFTFSSSNPLLATVAANGVVTSNNNDKTGVVTITAIDTVKNLVASTEIAIGTSPVGFTLTPDKEAPVVNDKVTLTLQLIDEDGVNMTDSGATVNVYTISKPDGAIVDTSVASDATTTISEDGSTTVSVSSDKAGMVKIQVVVTLASGQSLSKSYTLNFGTPKVVVGANKVVLTVGGNFGFVDGAVTSLDAPAFIEEGRTFVPVRFLAEAFGAEADWTPKDAAVETVFLTRDDMTITIGIGDSFLTVTKDGEAEVVTFDAAAQIKDGRTFLPFRAIAEAFGAEVDYGPADGPVEWVSFSQ